VDDGYFVAFDGLCSIRKRWSSSEVPDTRLGFELRGGLTFVLVVD
jgi:hypothetical protein